MAETPIIFQFQDGLQENDGIVTPVYGDGANEVLEGNDSRLSAQQVLIVKKNPGTGEFSSVKAAVDSVTDATAAKPYQIYVRAGVYTEDTITMKPFVNVRGVRNSTIIEVDAPSKDLVIGTNNSEISECTLRGSTDSGKALIRLSSTAAGDVFTVRDCLFGDADSFAILDSATLSQMTVIACLSLTSANATAAFKVGGAGFNILNLVGFSGSISAGKTIGKWVEAFGANTTVVVHCCGMINAGGTFTTALEVYDGATLNVNSSAILGAVTGLSVPNTGAGPLLRVANLTMNSITSDISMLHPSATGFLAGAWDHEKETINTSSTISVFHSDPTPGTGVAILGDILQGADKDKTVNLTKLTREGATVGLLTGGELTNGTGAFDLDIAAGTGFLDDGSGVVQEISWDAETQTLSGSPVERVYIVVNENGIVQRVSSLTDYRSQIILGRVVTNSAGIVLIEDSQLDMTHWGNRVEEFIREAIGPLFTGGCTLSENSVTDRALDMTSGEYFFGSNGYLPSGATPITFATVRRDGSGGYISVPGTTVVDNANYDNDNPGGTLEPIPAGKYAKHTILLIGDGAKQQQFLIYAQAVYDSEGEAVSAPLALEPPGTINALTRIGSIVIQQGNANIVDVIDERPQLGFVSSSTQTASDHGSLLGLEDDDHQQYFLASGARAMAGNLNVGGNNITNVGTVDGVDVSSHAARHLPNGDDPLTTAIAIGIDGDTTNSAGIQNSFARSDHAHAIATGVVSSQTPDQSNAEGTSASLARADHVHNIPADAPTANLSGDTTNQEGVANSFARSDHSHDIDTGAPSTQGPDNANAEGSSANLARADHIHNIPAAAPSSITPDGGNAEGTSSSFARADHVHDLPAAAPSAAIGAATTNEEGVAASVARSDHSHDILTATVSTQTPDQANAEGVSTSLARADHTHNIPAETAVDVGTVNAEGTANSFARSDHVHAHANQAGGTLHAVATQSVAGFMSSADKYILDQIMKIKALRKEETGFPNFVDAEFSFSDVTKQFTIQPKAPATEYSYFINGIEYVETGAKSVAINETVNSGEGVHLFYFDGSTLVADPEPPDKRVYDEVAFIAFIYWDSTNVRHIRINEERHGISMSGATHEYLHLTEGTRFISGLLLQSFTDGDGSSDSHAQYSCQDGEVRDEDIPIVIEDGSPQTLLLLQAPVFYLTGANAFFRRKDSNTLPLIYSGTAGYSGPNGRIPWNRDTGSGWVLQEAQEGYYVPMHVFASGDLEEPIIVLQGRSEYADLTDARDGALNEILAIRTSLSQLGKEFAPIGVLLYQTSSSYTNTAKARRVNTPGGDPYIDVRGLQIFAGETGASASNDHSSLTGLGNDDHQQYLNRSGVRAMEGNLDMGTNNITNVGTVDGVTVSAHKDRHRPDGADPIDTAAPSTNLTGDTSNEVGTSNNLSRGDHVHAIDTASAVGIAPDEANSEGTSASLARSDHIHNIPADIPSQQLADAANAEGVATSFARSDHIHNIPTAVPVTLSPDGGNQQGTSTSFAKADHSHDVPAAAPVTIIPDQVNSEGNSTSFSRANHVHNVPCETASSLTPDLGNSEGVADSFARSDHIHDVPAAVVSQQLADQTGAEGTANSFARSDHIHNIPTATPTDLTPDAGNSQGVSTSFAKADHVHNVPAAIAVAVGTANAEGVAASFARSDHVHDHGQQTQADLHAVATPSANGFMSAADKIKMDRQGVGVIQYSNSAQLLTSSTTFVALSLDTDRGSAANSFLTKASATDFRVDFAGVADISYRVNAYTDTNDRGIECQLYKNGTALPHTLQSITGKNVALRHSSAACNLTDKCAANDVYTLRIRSPEGAEITLPIDGALLTVKVYALGLT